MPETPALEPVPGEDSPPGIEATRHGVSANGKRWYEFETVLNCPAEDVWRAVTDGAEIAKWFALDAKVDPGVGGKVWLSWGPGWEGGSRIAIWEPGKRMAVQHWADPNANDTAILTSNEGSTVNQAATTADAAKPEAPADVVPIAVDYIIEGRGGGTTVLRIVQAGIGPGAEWDGEVDATSRGWRIFLSHLRNYLEHHRGEPVTNLWIDRCVGDKTTTWRKLLSTGSPLHLDRKAAGAPQPGSRFSLSAGGESMSGKVEFFGPSMDVGFVLDDPAGALMRLSLINYGPWTGFAMFLLAYGANQDKARLSERATRLHEGLIKQLGVGAAPPPGHPSAPPGPAA